MSIGKVYLVGAGPGDPELITRKGLRLLQTAEVVIYDRLIPPELLWEAGQNAELIDAGKQPTKHRLSQDDINATLVDRALRGKTVVRLKGGDPFVFGRGGEEALACSEYGIYFEIVPGISSANAVPAYAGIPLTHRHVSSSFTVVAGFEDPQKPDTSINYGALAQLGGTIVVLMGVKTLPLITGELMKHGMAEDTPAATIEWGTVAHQRTLIGTLSTIAALAETNQVQPPAITVIGEVVKLRQKGVQWYDLLPADSLVPDAVMAND